MSPRPSRGRRLAVYTDYRYKRLAGRLYAERAFALFLIELGSHVDQVTIVGKVDPEPGESHYPIPPEINFAELEYFATLTAPVQLLRSVSRSAVRFWRMLDEIDAVWLLGPHPLAVVFALLSAIRGRQVTLGVRQDFRRYVRARHPGRTWVVVAGDALEGIWRVMGRIFPVVAVGPELARQYPPARTLELVVSLVRESELRPRDEPLPSYEDDRLTALSVGRLEEEKNPLLLADILALLVAADPRWHLVICGEGPFGERLRDRLALLGVAEHAELRGYVPNDGGLRELYRSSHALLHVSWTEGLPQVLFEAFAARLPVVATAVGGVGDAAGDAALLIEPGDAASAAAALRRLATDSALRTRLIEAGDIQVRAHTLDAEAARTASFVVTRTRRVHRWRRPRAFRNVRDTD